MESKTKPPKYALRVLEWSLYEHSREEIIGDLYEQFENADRSLLANQIWFWRQTINTAFGYGRLKPYSLAIILSSICVFVFTLMVFAVAFLSYGTEAVFDKNYWTNGNIHLLFLEKDFWQSISWANVSSINHPIAMFINIPSIIWAIFSVFILRYLYRSKIASGFDFVLVAIVSLLGPYFIGYMLLISHEISLRKVGPIIAFMWIPIVYLVLPVGFAIYKRLIHKG
jgi:hypothetical protein